MALKRAAYTRAAVGDFISEQVRGRGGCAEVLAVTRHGTASSADLGGSSKYSNENFED